MWSLAKTLQYDIFNLPDLVELPYTISFVLRKRMQVDNLYQLDKEKRPPDLMIWIGSPEQIDDWIERVMNPKKRSDPNPKLFLTLNDIEG